MNGKVILTFAVSLAIGTVLGFSYIAYKAAQASASS